MVPAQAGNAPKARDMIDALAFAGWFALLTIVTVIITVPLINLMIAAGDAILRMLASRKR